MLNYCRGGGSAGPANAGGLAVGPSEVVASAHAELTYTFLTTPRKATATSLRVQRCMSTAVGLAPVPCH